jgi:hypothetical protein
LQQKVAQAIEYDLAQLRKSLKTDEPVAITNHAATEQIKPGLENTEDVERKKSTRHWGPLPL